MVFFVIFRHERRDGDLAGKQRFHDHREVNENRSARVHLSTVWWELVEECRFKMPSTAFTWVDYVPFFSWKIGEIVFDLFLRRKVDVSIESLLSERGGEFMAVVTATVTRLIGFCFTRTISFPYGILGRGLKMISPEMDVCARWKVSRNPW